TDQDVALRTYLVANGLTPGVNVHIVYEPNATILQQYAAHSLRGAWVDEQWAARLQVEDDANVFVDESTLWQDTASQGQYATAVLVARTAYLNAQPGAIDDLLSGQVISDLVVSTETPQVQTDAADAIKTLTGVTMTPAEKLLAWSRISFTNDPIGTSVDQDAVNAQKLGLIKSANISGIWDLGPLNSLLKAANPQATPIKGG
ncbi:MAG TPA: ABC transporter substrate-binding protein, partial [Actinomycetota bacterium]|nr:ABC transporter substrate-binding protein [Actinomycetota bacterium]